MRTRLTGFGVAVAVGLLATGCAAGTPGRAAEVVDDVGLTRDVASGCTEVGNGEGVSVDLTTALPLEGGGYYAEVSVPALGASEVSGFGGNDVYDLRGAVDADLAADPVTVAVQVVTETGTVAYDASTMATPELFQPNGPECDGENFRINLRATADGQLVAWPVGEPARDDQGRVSLAVHTLCGVADISDGLDSYTRVGGTLDDGAGGPPAGWNSPDQRGWAAIEGDVLTFQDERGHTEVFQRAGADYAPPICG